MNRIKLGIFTAIFSVAAIVSVFTPVVANALAPVDTTTIPVGWEDFVDAHRGTNIPADWRDVNYAVFQYDPDPSTFIIMVGNDSEFAIGDGGAGQTAITAQYFCRWNTSLSGGVGCNTPNSYSISTSKMYKMHLTNAEAASLHTSWPEAYDAYKDLFDPKPEVKPDFTYQVNSKDVTAKDYNQTLPTFTPDEGYTFSGYSVEWSLFKCAQFTTPGNVCENGSLADHQIQPQDQQYQFSVDTFGDYTLSAQYLVQQCYRYPSYPTTPDNCFYVDLQTEMPDYNFLTTTVHLPIDGSTINGDTKEGECDTSGFCTPPSPYKDCSTFGLDIGGYIGCLIGNFQIWFVATLKALFVPSAAFMEKYFHDFRSFIEGKFGFLVWPLTFAYDFVHSFFDGLNGTNNICAWSFGNVFSSDFKLNFCALEQNFPSAFNTARYMIQAFTVFVLISGLYTHYRRTIKT